MKKIKKVLMSVMIFGLLMWSVPLCAAQWYWGDNPSESYTAIYPSGEYWIPLPFTVVVGAGEEVVGAGGPEILYTGSATTGWRFDFNMGWYWGALTEGTHVVPNGMALAVDQGTEILPDGIYALNLSSPYWGLYYWTNLEQTTLLQVPSLNNIIITVGKPPVSAVPEPATILLMGLGLLTLLGERRRLRR